MDRLDRFLPAIKHRSFYRTCAVLVLTGGVLCLLTLKDDKAFLEKLQKSANVSKPALLLVNGEEVFAPHRRLLGTPRSTISPEDLCVALPEDEEDKHEICQNVHLRDDDDEKCSFTQRTSYCQIINGFINYTTFVYCDLAGMVGLSMTILVIWWVFLFVSLAVCADDFFCPSMVVIVKTLGLSPNVAGVTFLAFGNGAPDLFSAIVAFLVMRAGDAGMAVGGLFGAGMFVSAAIVGTMAIVKPFKVTERPFLRDDIFYLGSSFWMLWIIWREKIFLYDAVGFVLLYIFYVTLVVLSGSIYKRMSGKDEAQNDIVMTGSSNAFTNVHGKDGFGFPLSPTQLSLDEDSAMNGQVNQAFEGDSGNPGKSRKISMDIMLDKATAEHDKLGLDEDGSSEKKEDGSNNNDNDASTSRDGSIDLDAKLENTFNGEPVMANGTLGEEKGDDDDEPPALTQEDMPPWYKQFLHGMNPINTDEWSDMKIYIKIYEIWKCPIMLLLKLSIPVVLYEDQPLHNWNRYVNCFHLLTSPMICTFLLSMGLAKIGGVFPVWALMLLVGVCLAVPCYFTSVDYKPPRYHEAFGYMAFLVAMVWIYVIATEIVNLLTAFGVVLKLSNGILGLTLLAWGNSVGDFVADMVMARQGFPRMAFSACFGAPIFHLLLGTGIAFIARMGADDVKEFFVRLDTMLFISNICVLLSMIISLVVLTLTRFHATRTYGIVLLVFYVIFFILVVLVEVNVIPQEMR